MIVGNPFTPKLEASSGFLVPSIFANPTFYSLKLLAASAYSFINYLQYEHQGA